MDGFGQLSQSTLRGIVFELLPTEAGGWLRKALHNFSGNGRDGYQPTSAVIQGCNWQSLW
jgi:hypothetical protein